MNFLAHIYLSGEDDLLMVGNFIADSVRGKSFSEYPEAVQRGILLHRKIDSFTDNHDVVSASKDRLRPEFGKWPSVIVDVFYDHFLAIHWGRYHSQPLPEFSQKVYATLKQHHEYLPKRIQGFLPYMTQGDWLYNYSKLSGIERALWGISRRSRYNPEMDRAVKNLREEFAGFEAEFLEFFPDLEAMVNRELAG